MLLTILLQATDITGTIVSRLGDELFSIMLLVSYAIYAERRNKAMQVKFDKYIEADRERMLTVIENNTRVMERLEDHLDKR